MEFIKDGLTLAQAIIEHKLTTLVILVVALAWMGRKINRCERKHSQCESRLARALRLVVKLTTAEQLYADVPRRAGRRRDDDLTRRAVLAQVRMEADRLLQEIESEDSAERHVAEASVLA